MSKASSLMRWSFGNKGSSFLTSVVESSSCWTENNRFSYSFFIRHVMALSHESSVNGDHLCEFSAALFRALRVASSVVSMKIWRCGRNRSCFLNSLTVPTTTAAHERSKRFFSRSELKSPQIANCELTLLIQYQFSSLFSLLENVMPILIIINLQKDVDVPRFEVRCEFVNTDFSTEVCYQYLELVDGQRMLQR